MNPATARLCLTRAAQLLEKAGQRLDAQRAHRVRGFAGTLRAALDVLDAVPPESEVALEARSIAARQEALLSQALDEMEQEAPWDTH